jgi:hypothetical protein
MPTVCVEKYVDIEVDVELDDFDDDDLREECLKRGIIDDIQLEGNNNKLLAVVQELTLNRQDQAMRLLEELVYDCTGRIVVLR